VKSCLFCLFLHGVVKWILIAFRFCVYGAARLAAFLFSFRDLGFLFSSVLCLLEVELILEVRFKPFS